MMPNSLEGLRHEAAKRLLGCQPLPVRIQDVVRALIFNAICEGNALVASPPHSTL
ncbi:hypothetical protein GGD50_006026 [Rhizobium paranaense]|uniref:Uncharacterized protein n=1 Tax=Rhizobium paranaense TaxID=1650438 RepID=A0A7W8XXS4_9HYPH|nr:hypothetical protein [Rhizobium paranaense]